MYSTEWCGYCERAKLLLRQRGLPFEEVRIDEQPRFREQLYELRSGFKTQRKNIITRDFPLVQSTVADLIGPDPAKREAAEDVWDQFVQRDMVYPDKEFSDYNPKDLLNSSKWAIDHRLPLAQHWQFGDAAKGNGEPGQDTGPEERKRAAGDPGGLRLMWGPLNSARQAVVSFDLTGSSNAARTMRSTCGF